MPLPVPSDPDPFRRLEAIMEALLHPEGCPWDREQTHRTLRPYVIEEACEVVDAIDDGNDAELCAELGDLGLQIVFHAALARRRGAFDLNAVYESICAKLIRRHPHVFGDATAGDAQAVLRRWEEIKRAEKGNAHAAPPSALDGVPRSLPALARAARIQEKARRVNFDWHDIEPVLAKVREELHELERERTNPSADPRALEDEFGDLLFALVNLARFLRLDPEAALHRATGKFTRRFQQVEARLAERGRRPQDSTLEEMDALWNEAKAAERAPSA